MDPPDTTAPLFGGNGDLAGAAAAVDLDEIFEDCFAANEWALLNDTLAAEALEPGPPVQGARTGRGVRASAQLVEASHRELDRTASST